MKTNTFIAIVLAVIFLLVILSFRQCTESSNDEWKRNETNAFNSQMSKDPNTWTKDEAKRYDDFMEWNDKQNN